MRKHLVPLCTSCAVAVLAAQNLPQQKRNVIIFVADGLRPGSVNAEDAPTLLRVRTEGVNFTNSHSVYPTLTMPNASAIATGHYPGDTGQFANNVFPGFPLYDTGNFGHPPGTLTPTVEDDQVLGDLDDHFGGNYVQETSLLALARGQGYNTAAVGKTGPTAVQDVGELNPSGGRFGVPKTIILDAAVGAPEGIPASAETLKWLEEAGMSLRPPPRNQPAGNNTTPGTLAPNVAHQQWLVDALTKAILPKFSRSGKPFAVVFWSGDPDQTQHAQGDSLNRLVPGVNGPTSRAAVRNADNNLSQILAFLNATPAVRDSTDVFVTADHGFSTVSRHEIDPEGHRTASYSAKFTYRETTGRQEVNDGFMPRGALAIDLAHALNLPLYDPDSQILDAKGNRSYESVDPTVPRQTAEVLQRPALGNGAIGGTGRIEPPDASVIVTSSSIYVPDGNRDMVVRIVRCLAAQDYIGGIFVNDRFGAIAGSLPMSAIEMIGAAKLPTPAVVISLKSFATDPRDPLMTSVLVGGVTQQEGQGNHGVLSRANTFNNMAAIGPDFKKSFVDRAPVSNADIQPTLTAILGFGVPGRGALKGRVLLEALAGGPSTVGFETHVMHAREENGRGTVLQYQQVGRERYLDEACFVPGPAAARCSP